MCDQHEQCEQNPLEYQKLLGTIFTYILHMINMNKVNKSLSNIKSIWEDFLTKYLCDHCKQSEQNSFKYQMLFKQIVTKFLSDSCEQSEQNLFKYQKLLGKVLNLCFVRSMHNVRKFVKFSTFLITSF